MFLAEILSMFTKKSKETVDFSFVTTVGESVHIEGQLRSEEDVRFNGKIQGDISSSGTVHVLKQAEVRGNITAENIVLHGNVQGNCTASQDVVISATGVMKGDVKVGGQFTLTPGATFQGMSSMTESVELSQDIDDDDDEFDIDLDDL
jgi:cytoskeletal protein CcmA (bactofilin family)